MPIMGKIMEVIPMIRRRLDMMVWVKFGGFLSGESCDLNSILRIQPCACPNIKSLNLMRISCSTPEHTPLPPYLCDTLDFPHLNSKNIGLRETTILECKFMSKHLSLLQLLPLKSFAILSKLENKDSIQLKENPLRYKFECYSFHWPRNSQSLERGLWWTRKT